MPFRFHYICISCQQTLVLHVYFLNCPGISRWWVSAVKKQLLLTFCTPQSPHFGGWQSLSVVLTFLREKHPVRHFSHFQELSWTNSKENGSIHSVYGHGGRKMLTPVSGTSLGLRLNWWTMGWRRISFIFQIIANCFHKSLQCFALLIIIYVFFSTKCVRYCVSC